MRYVPLVALFAAAAIAPAVAQGKPTYEQARRLTNAMRAVVAETGVWSKKPLPARIEAARAAKALVDETEKLLGSDPSGPFGQCRAAAIGMQTYVLNLNDLALLLEGRRQLNASVDLVMPQFFAFQFGEAYSACRDQIEALDTGARRAKP